MAAVCRSGYYQLYGSSGRSSGRCHLTPSKRWSRRLFHVTWTTVTNFSTASRTVWWVGRLQSVHVQNAAARLVSGARLCDHITQVLQELHWLPVRRRVDFKMATLVYISLFSMAPAYLAADCQLVSGEGRRQLRFVNSRTCVVRRTYSNYGDRCFAAASQRLWNSLPVHLRQTDINFKQFKRLLKTFLFGCWERGALWLTFKLRLLSHLTYLLTYSLKLFVENFGQTAADSNMVTIDIL